jgi:hypothetical protein
MAGMDEESSEEDFAAPAKAIKKQKFDKDAASRLNRPLFAPIYSQRSCDVCGTTETPQWRTGPPGKRNLCNA